jgi:hypothetical protein
LGVTLILTLDSLSPFAEGDDVPRQRHRPFVPDFDTNKYI